MGGDVAAQSLDCRDTGVSNGSGDIASVDLKNDQRLPLWRRLTFAAGGLPLQLLSNILSFFLPMFLLETVKLAPVYISIIQLVARISDALTDPIVGYLVLKTNTRIGRKRPWIIISTPVFVVSFFVLFYTVDLSDLGKLAVYVTAVIFLQIGLTCFHVPYSSMTMVLTNNPRERDTLTAYRMFSEVFAVLLGVTVFGSIVSDKGVCETEDSGSLVNSTSPVPPKVAQNKITAYMIAAGVSSAIAAIAALICFFGTREVHVEDVDRTEAEAAVSYLGAVRRILTFRPYLYLMASFLFVSLAIQLIQGNVALYIIHTLKMSSFLTPGICALLASAIILLPFAQFLVLRVGKKTTLLFGVLNMLPLLVVLLFIPESPPTWALFVMMIWAGFTIAVAMLLPWSMLPDVIDAFSLKENIRKEAVFYSLYVFFNKFAVGISLATSAGILELVGYDVTRDACNQHPDVGKALRYISSIGPIICFLPALVFLYFYPLGTKQLTELRAALTLQSQDSTEDILTDGDVAA